MTCLRYPDQRFHPTPSDSFFLDTSFVIAGIGKRPHCYSLLKKLLGRPLYLSELVRAEAVHVLTRTFVGHDFRALFLERQGDLLKPEAARSLRNLGLGRKGYSERLIFEAVYVEALKQRTSAEKAWLVPYQDLATAAIQGFIAGSDAETLAVGSEDRLAAHSLMREVALDSYDALHLAVAHRAGCTHFVTRDKDFAEASGLCPVTVLQVA